MKKIALALILGVSLYAAGNHQGKIEKTMNSGGYTYMKVKDGSNAYWIAMTQRNVKVGDTIKFTEQGLMKNFHSSTLNRTFKKILFAGDVQSPTQMHMQQLRSIKPKIIKSNIMKSKYQTKNTLTIAELFKNPDAYVGKTVTVRAKVVKVSPQIMQLNWIHLEDGSRFMNKNDLVFTSKQTPPHVGDIIYATGKVIKDKDFGYGYFYPLLIQNSTFHK